MSFDVVKYILEEKRKQKRKTTIILSVIDRIYFTRDNFGCLE